MLESGKGPWRPQVAIRQSPRSRPPGRTGVDLSASCPFDRMRRMKVAVVQGGPSAEAEVSRVSAAAVGRALVQAGHEVALLELEPELSGRLLAGGFDVVFPAVHGRLGEDGGLQGLLEVLDLAYVGSQVLASAICADKVTTKTILRAQGLPLAAERVVPRESAPVLAQLAQDLGTEIVVKPPAGGSAIGVSRLLAGSTQADLDQAIALARQQGPLVLIERYVRGLELTCGVLEGDAGPVALPPTLISAQHSDWYDFESKYGDQGSKHLCPAPLEEGKLLRIQELAVAAHVAVGARDLSRTDMILGADGQIALLEINTLPGMTGVSLFPEAAQAAGIGFADLVSGLATRAYVRHQARPRALVGRPLPGS
jgi:D-alanine-D-alanine ligase